MCVEGVMMKEKRRRLQDGMSKGGY